MKKRKTNINRDKANGTKIKEKIADEVADKLFDLIKEDPELRGRFLEAAMRYKEFKRKVVDYTVEQMS